MVRRVAHGIRAGKPTLLFAFRDRLITVTYYYREADGCMQVEKTSTLGKRTAPSRGEELLNLTSLSLLKQAYTFSGFILIPLLSSFP